LDKEKGKPNKGALRGLFSGHPFIQVLLWTIALGVIVELFARRAPFESLVYIFTKPHHFALNVLILLSFTSLSLLFRKRVFAFALIASVWFGLGVGNMFLLGFRTTPLAAIDFMLLGSVWSILNNYLNLAQAVIIAASFILLIVLLVFVYKKTQKRPVYIKTAIAAIVVTAALTAGSLALFLNSRQVKKDFTNLPEANDKYGFVSCFFVSIVDSGIDKPQSYFPYKIESIRKELQKIPDRAPLVLPDIIMVQMESFYDFGYIEGISCNKDPTPFFNKLKKEFSSGMLTVPTVGAGTANTEFEVITGMNLDSFGAGEYPYKTILQFQTCETVNYDLKELGYTCCAIHNHNGSFYDRNVVFPHLGFDVFDSLEYMQDVTFTPTEWAEDRVLVPRVLKALDSTPGKDFIYAISVQGHGKYPRDPIEGFTPEFSVHGAANESLQYAYEYYLTQLNASDRFLEELVKALEDRGEPVILVIFGDHLPNFDIQSDEIETGSRFKTEYVIWSNTGLVKKDRDVYSYQLASYVLDRAGITNGILVKVHQKMSDRAEYLEVLELLEYDTLYGDRVLHRGRNPYEPTDMRMGIDVISLTGAAQEGEDVVVSGENFTRWSCVLINGKKKDTVMIDSGTLLVRDEELKPGDEVVVAQIGEDGSQLSGTPPVIVA